MTKNARNRRGVLLIFQCGFRVTPLAKLVKIDEFVGIGKSWLSGNQAGNHLAVQVGQSLVQATKGVDQPFMVQAEKMKDGCM